MCRSVLSLSALCLCAAVAAGQCPGPASSSVARPGAARAANPPTPQLDLSALAARQASADDEALFKRTGPKLFATMAAAEAESARTGKPVVCWMGPGIFQDPRARAASRRLADTTVQAAMDDDGERVDADGKPLPARRVKVPDGTYAGGKVAYIAVDKLDADSPARILAFARGGAGGR